MKKAFQSTENNAREMIFAQPLPLGVRRSAWWLYLHELSRLDPATGRNYTRHRAIKNVLGWMREQQVLIERMKQHPTQTQLLLLQMLADGKTQKEIAFELGKNYGTLALHFMHLRRRLGVETLYQVVAISVKRGWVRVKQDRN
jgi:DNA-binding NarL/FixJ family response regulator